ncbi:HEPN domain protein [bacterium BMS3Abin14]|nr:HEPN domain protein [bacterium BMS3Abin14]
MVDPKVHEIRQWLVRAEHDLRSAGQLFIADPPLLDTAVYHCQQTAEKAFKAYLTLKDTPFQKVHALSVLVEQCMQSDPTFAELMDIADLLTPYAIAFRYPGDVLEPARKDAQEALDAAEEVLNFVLARLPVTFSGWG